MNITSKEMRTDILDRPPLRNVLLHTSNPHTKKEHREGLGCEAGESAQNSQIRPQQEQRHPKDMNQAKSIQHDFTAVQTQPIRSNRSQTYEKGK
jgi:hypothetical protein